MDQQQLLLRTQLQQRQQQHKDQVRTSQSGDARVQQEQRTKCGKGQQQQGGDQRTSALLDLRQRRVQREARERREKEGSGSSPPASAALGILRAASKNASETKRRLSQQAIPLAKSL
jgi:hypothetical protein